ncbi:MAG: hypothetical protein IKL74_01840 [Clostridia bacterium]|nr:hypothetical protein [Clostridia bacterium]
MDKKIWKYMMDNLFSDETKLFYDYIVPEKRGDFKNYLPSPEFIKKCIPSPTGWGTGMEDSVINGSVMLDSALLAYEVTKEEAFLVKARDFFKGLKLCATISESEGFLARSVSPFDGKSHYIDSSRDQYTHYVASAAKYYESGKAKEDEIKAIKETLLSFARRARANVTEENKWNMLREDGGQGFVTALWNAAPHEMMRLPMIYLAAWKISGDESFKEDYLKYRDFGMDESEKIVYRDNMRPFAIGQMQLSLRFCYDYDFDIAFRERCYRLMAQNADYGFNKALECAKENLTEENREIIHTKATAWNETPAWFNGYLSDYAYYVPMHFKSLFAAGLKGAWHIRDIGDAASIYMNLPGAEYKKELFDALSTAIGYVDTEKYTSDAVCYLLTPYYKLLLVK